jgi:acyl-CoA reductase-like NAD-dependent aldehyde dehydrogenase
VAATDDAWAAQPLWSLVPVDARARYLRRAAVAMLDELDDLALALAEETGRDRGRLLDGELLPAARGLRALADEGPRALADRRLSSRSARLAGRVTRMAYSPVGVIGLRGPSASPWAEPALEAGAALLAGNSVLLGFDAPRLRAVFLRAGLPGEVFVTVAPPRGAADDPLAACRRVIDLPRPGRLATLLVLPGAVPADVVDATLHAADAGRLITVAGAVPGLFEALGEVIVVAPDDPRFLTPPLGPVLAVVEAADIEEAIALTARVSRDAAVSVWARDRAQGERIARRLPSPVTWIGRHGVSTTPVHERIARHVVARRLEWRAPWAPRLPVARQQALAEARHGRDSRRWPALKALAQRGER